MELHYGMGKGEGKNAWGFGELDRAIALDNNYAIAYYSRGMVKSQTGKLQEVLQDFKYTLAKYQKNQARTHSIRVYTIRRHRD